MQSGPILTIAQPLLSHCSAIA